MDLNEFAGRYWYGAMLWFREQPRTTPVCPCCHTNETWITSTNFFRLTIEMPICRDCFVELRAMFTNALSDPDLRSEMQHSPTDVGMYFFSLDTRLGETIWKIMVRWDAPVGWQQIQVINPASMRRSISQIFNPAPIETAFDVITIPNMNPRLRPDVLALQSIGDRIFWVVDDFSFPDDGIEREAKNIVQLINQNSPTLRVSPAKIQHTIISSAAHETLLKAMENPEPLDVCVDADGQVDSDA